jgi:Cytochrome c oxidase subunit IV
MAEEIAVFARSAVYFFAIGLAYWFLTYEVAGSMLLVGSALASAFVAVVLRLGLRGRDTVAADASKVRPDGPFGDESGALPAPTAAPLGVAFGLALVVLGLVFTGALVLAGAILILLASREWLRAAMSESSQRPKW